MSEKTINEQTLEKLTQCPDCGGEVHYYHDSITHGSGLTRVVCSSKCNGWKVLRVIDRKLQFQKSKEQTNEA